MLSSVVLKDKPHVLFLKEGSGAFPRKILQTNKAGEAISGHFLKAILLSVSEQFQRILLPFILYAIFKYKIQKDTHMSVLVLCVDINVQI